MAKFNPDFWEVSLSQRAWDALANEDGAYFEDPEELRQRHADAACAQALRQPLQEVLAQVLTAKQREVVVLYFYGRLNQRQIAERLSISQQAVSEHLYGKVRNGRTVGGALRKLRRECGERGLVWPSSSDG